ncbi:MAG: hypothetical protein MUE83_07195 [Tabrizicola sp.]|nr:hypothetical protein [Tabrizicola sp.]
MRVSLSALVLSLVLPAVPVTADTTTIGSAGAEPAAKPGIAITTSISLNLPLTAADRVAKIAEEEGYRRDLYARSVKECEVLLESIAAACTITSVNVSTQMNSSPGQPDYRKRPV